MYVYVLRGERYGMTEIGMALSNPYEQSKRQIGSVGMPLPGVECKINKENNELYVKSLSMFKEYYRKPEKTKEEFTKDGWFKTGDIVHTDEKGYFYIDGRASVDIIKYSGYKISALEIERILLQHHAISETCVVGLKDQMYGQIIAAIIVLKSSAGQQQLTEEALKLWCRDKMAHYKIPRKFLFVQTIPRNAMNKVNKKELVVLFDQV
ncbi:acyl-activating enzyme 13 (AAE13) [Reticulomyxa filosa]|uniref:Acyl-activating enzyme 13 (AAE13) n=1 Tax=Reticulomyxa filosa TaxID=46433 RepID=X6N1W9_RETFI|nr:acyl-activating enzyme 13 (AAE13) [Reticulomyxa filosa]|eukprot:ETO20270.1 acyl-activating enzyme 13 (AAE13) [Reticulomyxa filosa]